MRVLLNDVAPYTMRAEAALYGMHHDILHLLEDKLGLAFDVNVGPYVRLPASLADGSADMVVAVEGPDLDAIGKRVAPFHEFKFVVLSKKASAIAGVADLRGKLLGVARGAFYADSINNDPEIRKFGITDPFQGVRMLALDRLDAVISSDYLLSHAMRQARVVTADFGTPFVVNEKRYTLYARKDLSEQAVQRMQAAMEALRASGRIAEVLARYK
ncbi:substrate-binding periplasmic protein [Paucibacter soli]|uniref:substrate-binding periplasmic protein n=1 Tax=Paucibacter soli TaxID=3133433 RepID=UPI00309F9335